MTVMLYFVRLNCLTAIAAPQREKLYNYFSKKFTGIFLFCCLLLTGNIVFAQQKITGVVLNENNMPVAGANISIKNSTTATVTQADGSFTINAKTGDDLEISFVGYKTQQIKISAETSVKIILQSTIVSLDDVVVTGYSSQKIKEITGSVSIVKPKELVAVPVGQVEQMLQGRVAGLTVITSGEPGAPVNIHLHGVGNFGDVAPLYIIDGIPGDLNALNPYDIESLQVLKDAGSYSVYGVRGANGVIVVTTKKGKQGKTRINYDMYVGWQKPGKGPELLNPQENANLLWLSLRNSGQLANGNPSSPLYGNGPTPILPDYLFAGAHRDTLYEGSPYAQDSLYNLNPDIGGIYQIVKFNKTGTDWYNEMFNPAFSQQHTLSFSGGHEKNLYLVSLGYLDQQGTLLNTYLKKFTLRVNTDFNYKNNFHFGENIQLSYTDNPQSYKWIGGSRYNNDVYNIFTVDPASPVYDTHGAWNPGYGNGKGPDNNAVFVRTAAKDNKGKKWEALGNIYAALDFLKYFNFRSSFGGNLVNYSRYNFQYQSYDQTSNPNTLTESEGYITNWTWTNILNFSRVFSKHSIKALAGTEYIQNYNREAGGSASDLPFQDPSYWLLSNGDPLTKTNYSEATSVLLSSFISKVDYGYDGKYFLSITLRQDGSSVFGSQNRYGWFPAVAAAWRISEENFMMNATWVNELKLRGSWGKTGFNGNTDPVNQYSLYGGSVYDAYYDINGISSGSIQRGFRRVRIGNANTGWQEDEVTNLGIETILWKGKLSITADFYNKKTTGLLFPIILPDLLGDATPPNANVGDIKNTGYDLTIGSRGKFSKNWRWNLLLTVTHYENKIIKLNNLSYFDDLNGIIRNEVGHPISSFYGYQIIGIFQSDQDVAKSPIQPAAAPGRFKYADLNSFDSLGRKTGKPDGKINDADRTHFGNPHPKFTAGINIEINYKNFDFSTFLYGSFGNHVMNIIRNELDIYPVLSTDKARSSTALYDSWTPDHKNASAPMIDNTSNFSNSNNIHSYPLEGGSYLRDRSMMFGYTFPNYLLNKMKLDRLRVYVQVTNLFTITNYSGLDPELSNTGSVGSATNSAFGVDQGNFPNNQKQFLVGINLGL